MKTIKITKEAFEAYEFEAKVKYLDDMRKELGNKLSQVQIGNEVFSDRESLQKWQIGKGLLSTKGKKKQE